MHEVIALYELVLRMVVPLAGVIPDPKPASPPVGTGALTTMVAWLKWGALLLCVAAAVMAGGMIAVGNTSRRAELAERGKVTLICALIGAVIVAVGGALVRSFYGLG